MAERSTTAFQRLFEVRLLHHYWLDDGNQPFDALAADVRAERLLTYDIRPVFKVAPTPSTRRRLDGLRCVFVATGAGFVVAVESGVALPADARFSFAVSIADGRCLDYTALTFRPQTIHEASDPDDHTPDRKVFRYKQDVPVLSNLTGARRTLDGATALFLSRDYPPPDADDPVESLVLSGGTLLQLSGDNPGADTHPLGNAAGLPVYVHQADAPAITPPAGVVGAPARGVLLGADVPDGTFALITLAAVRGDDDAFDFVDGDGLPRTPAPVYQVRFKNRSTFWTYRDKRTGAVDATEPAPLPLTYFGNAGTRQKPSRGIVKADKSGTRITRLVSEIYV